MGRQKNKGTASQLSANSGAKTPNEIAQRYKELFRKQTPAVRQILVNDLPSYSQLIDLELQDMSFDELGLMCIAQEHSEIYDRQNPPLVACPHCGSVRTKKRTDKDNLYYCNDCKHSSAASFYNSIAWGSKENLLTWTKFINALLSYQTVSATCDICDITPNTYVRMRNCVFFLAEQYLKGLRLGGNIQCDETFCRISYRGSSLKMNQFDDTDIRFSERFVSREAKKRGGAFGHRNQNQIAIFCAIDSFNNVYCCYSGIGAVSFKSLKKHVPAERFLSTVPENPKTIPFATPMPKEPDAKPGDKSLFICDGSKTLVKYATDVLGMKTYSRVFRKKGKQLKISKKNKHLHNQKINHVHMRLQEHLRRSGCSSRYLRGELALFCFMANTNAPKNQKAVNELLKLLVKPNLFAPYGPSAESYTALPDFIYEWFDEDNNLRKIGFPTAYAFYLYDQYKHPEDYPGQEIPTLNEVSEWSGLSMPYIRNRYANLLKNGYRLKIKRFFESRKALKVRENSADIDPILLMIHKKYSETRSLPVSQRQSFGQVCDAVLSREPMSAALAENYSANAIYSKLRDYVNNGILEPFPQIRHSEKIAGMYHVEDAAIALLEEYEAYIHDCLSRGEPKPLNRQIQEELHRRHPEYKASTITRYLQRASQLKKQQGKISEFSKSKETKQDAIESIFDMYSEYVCCNRADPKKDEAFLKNAMGKYGLSLTTSVLLSYFSELIESGVKDPIHPDIRSIAKKYFPEKDIEQLTVKEVREKTGMSQGQFAEYFEINVRTLQGWECRKNEIDKRTFQWLIRSIEDQRLVLPGGLVSATEFSKETGIHRTNVIRYMEQYRNELAGHLYQTGAYGWMLDKFARQFILDRRTDYIKKYSNAVKNKQQPK